MPAVPSQFSGGSGTPDLIAILQALLAQSGAGQMTGMGASGRPQANSSPFPNIPAINTPQIPFMPAMSGNIPGLSGQGGGGGTPSGGGGGKGGGKGGKGGGKGGFTPNTTATNFGDLGASLFGAGGATLF